MVEVDLAASVLLVMAYALNLVPAVVECLSELTVRIGVQMKFMALTCSWFTCDWHRLIIGCFFKVELYKINKVVTSPSGFVSLFNWLL